MIATGFIDIARATWKGCGIWLDWRMATQWMPRLHLLHVNNRSFRGRFLCVPRVCVCLAVAPRPQSATASVVRDESPVDQEQRCCCTDTKQPCCTGSHQPSTVTTRPAEQVTTADSLLTLTLFTSSGCCLPRRLFELCIFWFYLWIHIMATLFKFAVWCPSVYCFFAIFWN